jgi:hypothetical protein
MVKWRDLGMSMKRPKIHAVEDHMLRQMSLYVGSKDFVEDFIKQGHQQIERNRRDRRLAAYSNS